MLNYSTTLKEGLCLRLLSIILVLVISNSSWAYLCPEYFSNSKLVKDMLDKQKIKNGEIIDTENTQAEDYLSAFSLSVGRANHALQGLLANKRAATIENTFEKLQIAEMEKQYVLGSFIAVHAANKTAEMSNVYSRIVEINQKYETELYNNIEFFQRVEHIYKNRGRLTIAEKRLVEKLYQKFRENGFGFPAEQSKELYDLKLKLSDLQQQYSNNLLDLKAQNSRDIKDVYKLRGLSLKTIEKLKKIAEEDGKDGYSIKLDTWVVQEINERAEDPMLRMQVLSSYLNRGHGKNKFNNEQLVRDIVATKHRIAQLIGYKSYADYAFVDRVANSPEEILALVEELKGYYLPKAREQLSELKAYKKEKTGDDKLYDWDQALWRTRLQKERYSFDQQALMPYFSLPNVQKGLFTTVQKLFRISIRKDEKAKVYHPDVSVYKVYSREGELMGQLIIDLFTRDEKSAGGWHAGMQPSFKLEGQRVPAVSTIVLNINKDKSKASTLLTLSQAESYFHEMGHALHSILSRAPYAEQAGTRVSRDVVELPSQFLENYLYEPKTLKSFAKHYETGQSIPEEYIQAIIQSRQFFSAVYGIANLNYILLDLTYYMDPNIKVDNFVQFENDLRIENSNMVKQTFSKVSSTSFSHIFEGGYSAGYYSYLYASLLEAQVFSIFKQKGLFDAETSKRYLQGIIEVGGSADLAKAFKQFAREDVSIYPLLQRMGIDIPESN